MNLSPGNNIIEHVKRKVTKIVGRPYYV